MPRQLSTPRAVALYVGALFGPGLLLLPALAARIAGPASILAWLTLLVLSALFAVVFTGLGVRFGGRSGVTGYVRAGFGARTGRVATWCFASGVVLGAPVVCLIGGGYVAALIGAGRVVTVLVAVAMVVLVVAMTLGGTRASARVQFGLVCGLVLLVAVAVVGSAGAWHVDRWTPFAPHGWRAVGSAAATLMLSFVGWEAIAPMTARLREPARQLPRVIGWAFAVTACGYLALAVSTVSVLGADAGGNAPLAELMEVAVGPAGRIVAAVAAIGLTLAAVNAYVCGAAEMVADLNATPRARAVLPVAILAVGSVLLGLAAAGLLSTQRLVGLPTTLFLVAYLLCMLSAVRLLRGAVRGAAALAAAVVAGVLVFCGWPIAVAAAIAVLACLRRGRIPSPAPHIAAESVVDAALRCG
jgi:amino acid efflux transporter